MPNCNELVIYETHVGTFHRDGSDDVGTFEDYIKKFDHLKSRGVNALQIMPIAEFAGDLSWVSLPKTLSALIFLTILIVDG